MFYLFQTVLIPRGGKAINIQDEIFFLTFPKGENWHKTQRCHLDPRVGGRKAEALLAPLGSRDRCLSICARLPARSQNDSSCTTVIKAPPLLPLLLSGFQGL